MDIFLIQEIVVDLCAISAFISIMLFLFDKKHRDKLNEAKVDKTIVIPIILVIIIIVLFAMIFFV